MGIIFRHAGLPGLGENVDARSRFVDSLQLSRKSNLFSLTLLTQTVRKIYNEAARQLIKVGLWVEFEDDLRQFEEFTVSFPAATRIDKIHSP